ncbi:uncharacterized protein BX663DRAFT_517986 [Cokeromyces recurvatus]|uniref:uncharacterized protein n=1 Tax=Cokeromyces recurvatus TaxID=90255 RepID=UPI00221E94BA|nr:uncharacterized protein BX663DRAFT_517986 [Cokeromyces recurvatus]KAI7900232.1 hypothetical protein BX663DRAFT_517986 [Cokeromyces recurvatus]
MTLPSHFANQLLQLKSEDEIKTITKDQDECLANYKEIEQKLEAFNKFSQARYQNIHKHFEAHTKLLKEIKEDLNSVFIKLRKIKNQLGLKYPNEMEQVLKKYPDPRVDDEE